VIELLKKRDFDGTGPGIGHGGPGPSIVEKVNELIGDVNPNVVALSADAALTSPVIVLDRPARLELDTTLTAIDVYMPEITAQMLSVEVVILAGANPVTLRPAAGSSDGVSGTAGSTDQMDPLAGDMVASFTPAFSVKQWLR